MFNYVVFHASHRSRHKIIFAHGRISNSALNDNEIKTVDTVTGDMICHRYRAFVKVQLKPKKCVRKHFEQLSFLLRT